MNDLFQKYDVPAPRYTSYPTVPFWNLNPSTEEWLNFIDRSLTSSESSWSLYIHIPFCETLCTFCGCNTSITKNHTHELPYVERVLKEWQLYKEKTAMLLKRPLKVLHLGGGTPTYLSPQHLEKLLQPIFQDVLMDKNFEGSIEVDPRRTSIEHLKVLQKFGFHRISLGVQDFNNDIQKIINRNQTIEQTLQITNLARELGYQSVNWDLIYGLPLQTQKHIEEAATIIKTALPDRIALYSFALVPWIKPQQRLFKNEDLPVGQEKRKLYELARSLLLEIGYVEIGMDHFSLPSDSLAIANNSGKLHRNFMGYVDKRTDLLLGLGVSAISETVECFHQNEKVLTLYEQNIDSRKIPTHRGHKLNKQDQLVREQILQLMTQWEVVFENEQQKQEIQSTLAELEYDNLITIDGNTLKILPKGKPFLRNVCMAFDLHLKEKAPTTRIFSQSL